MPPPGEERVQVNLSKYVVDSLIKVWLDKGARPGTIKDICERAVRLWLTVFANEKRDGETIRFKESQTGQDLRRLSDRLDRDLGETTSRSVKEALIARIGVHIAVTLLKTPGFVDPSDDLFHELFAAAERFSSAEGKERRIGDEIVDRLKLARKVLEVSPDMTVRELLKSQAKGR